ncbi:MAG: DUF4190 domain-containing protein [Anaerolineaceae bacterium]|nr:DUF4190 domain-containing protein [Anaerolineaceae bacterium]
MTTPVYTEPAGYPQIPPAKRDSTLAIISLVTGIVGWTIFPFIGSIVAVITGHLAKKEIRESGGLLGGDGMALAGLILGYTMIGLTILAIIVFITVIVLLVPTTSNLLEFTSLIPCLM